MSFWDFVRGSASVRLLVEFGLAHGLPAARLLQRSGLSQAQLDDPHVALTAAQELQVVGNLLRGLKHPPGLGLEVGARYNFSTYGLWGYGLVSSATAADALALALRFIPLTFAFTLISARQEGAQCILSFGEPDLDTHARRFLVERDMAAAARLMKDVVGEDFSLTRFTLREPLRPTRATGAGPATMGGVPIEYGAPANSLAFHARFLTRPLPQANPVTVSMCEQMCRQLMARRRVQLGTAELIRQYLIAMPDGAVPDLPQVAQLVNLSERTLKRRLREEGTTFTAILSEYRGNKALELMADRTLSLTEIAERLGFSDLSSFSQAFKRWSGAAPSAHR